MDAGDLLRWESVEFRWRQYAGTGAWCKFAGRPRGAILMIFNRRRAPDW